MKHLQNVFRLGSVLLCFISGITQGQPLPKQTLVDAKAATTDPRLNVPMNFDADRMYLGEALEKISAQTGVMVAVPFNDPSSGIRITCHLKNVTLASFMDSVCSLVGYSKATWQITKEASQQRISYLLLPTDAWRTLPDHLNREADQAAAKLWNLFLKFSTMSPLERQANKNEFKQALLQDNDDIANSYLEDTPFKNQFWSRFGLVATELSAAQQEQLQQGATISIPINHLTKEHQDLISPYLGHPFTIKEGVRVDLPPPDTLVFYFSRQAGNQKRLMRDLYIGVTSGSEGDFTGSGTMAPMEIGLKLRLYNSWLLPGDLRNAAQETDLLSTLPQLPAESFWKRVPSFDLLLTEFADAQNASYIAIVPEDTSDSTTLSVGKPIKQCFEDLRLRTGLMHKWRNGVLLLNYPSWFYGDDGLYPYDIVKRLRENSRRRNDGRPLMLAEIADPIITLNDAQMKRLAKEFPQVEYNKTMRPIFVFYKKYPHTHSEDGMAVDLNMLSVMQQLKLIQSPAKLQEIDRVRIIEDLSHLQQDKRLYRMQYKSHRQTAWEDIGQFYILSSDPFASPGA